MSYDPTSIVDLSVLARSREELGASFVRMMSYFREDGRKSVLAIEEAMRARNAAALVLPAHTLKGESLQFGAQPLADLAEKIEMEARRCVEHRETPTELLGDVVRLKPLFEATLALFERELNPLVDRKPNFGRRGGVSGGRRI